MPRWSYNLPTMAMQLFLQNRCIYIARRCVAAQRRQGQFRGRDPADGHGVHGDRGARRPVAVRHHPLGDGRHDLAGLQGEEGPRLQLEGVGRHASGAIRVCTVSGLFKKFTSKP